MQESLSLDGSARQVSFTTVFLKLGNVALHGFPSLDLAFVIICTSTHIVSTVPLKPSSGIMVPNPSLFNPIEEWFGGAHLEKI
ncbi:hypothetical protein [Candidatus Nitrotoga sp. M5]|uniref:hypothetical protein n=1 Tax=Candidatus Nitrotoga sp. M5 TaxID=2890409 RepID=UPI001EF18D8C|nr:hypothetical protein [Candidatus Nitrotoga sp. M5]